VADEIKKKRKRIKTSLTGRATPKPTPSRYTPPIPESYKHSSRWVPILMFGFFGLGVAVIILNYLPGSPFLPGGTDNKYLFGGLILICLGFVAATRYQ